MEDFVDLGGLRPFGGPGLFEHAQVSDKMWSSTLIPPSPGRERAAAASLAFHRKQGTRLEALAKRLRRLVGRHDPAELLKAIAIPAGTDALRPGSWRDDAAATFSWPAKVEYLLGLALSQPPGNRPVGREVVDETARLIREVFDAAMSRYIVGKIDDGPTGDMAVDRTLFMLPLERLTDRMPGYVRHIEQIDAEVFDRHRERYVADLGFNGDVCADKPSLAGAT